ncbi:MAG: hypothetical protein IPN86_17285 [Saprospiraceae bacterium]|nr:hypothetical protein [Saprospiraceae bacterium]
MKNIFILISVTYVLLSITSCKNDIKTPNTDNANGSAPVSQNDSKALEGTGASDMSATYKLDQTQIVQPGNVAFNFKSANSLQVYIKSADANAINFEENEVFAIFADATIKETSFIVEGLDTKGETPVLNVKTKISEKTVAEYRPSYVVKIPKKDVKGVPTIRLDGAEIPVFGMQ